MHSNDNGRTGLEQTLLELGDVRKHIAFFEDVGMTREAAGAVNCWLLGAIRVAMTPAETKEVAESKITLLVADLHGWAMKAGLANGLSGAAGLVMGALAAEAHGWGIELPAPHSCRDSEEAASGYAAVFDPGVVASYRKDAKRRRLGPAIRRYERLVAEIDALIERGERGQLLRDALYWSREALLDAVAVSTRDVADLERKHRGWAAFRELHNPSSWLFSCGMSVAMKVAYRDLGLPPSEVERLKGMSSFVWTSDTPFTAEDRARARAAR